MPENEEAAPILAAQREAAQAGDAKAEATGTAKASDELSGDDLEAVAGGVIREGEITYGGVHYVPKISPYARVD